MRVAREYGGIDAFRLVAALLIVCIHTSPLACVSQDADFLLTHMLARIAVPFFLMASGFFVLPKVLFSPGAESSSVWRFVKKAALLYAIATALYLPVNLYAGRFAQIHAADILRDVLFDGTFYHLWYLPASILGMLIVYLLSRKLRFRSVFLISLLLYAIGLFGDSYFGAVAGVPAISAFYTAMFRILSFTRNGLFLAPLFLVIGGWIGHTQKSRSKPLLLLLFAVSLCLMILEGLILRALHWPRHDSMYLLLPVCSFFLFSLLVSSKAKPKRWAGTLSLWIYLLHPLCIVLVRGLAKATGAEALLVGNSLVHFLAVLLLSALLSALITILTIRRTNDRFAQGRAWIELSSSALKSNVAALRASMPKDCALMAVVKADAYGHGAVLIARELTKLCVKSFCVASVLEGVELHRHGIRGEILVLGYTHPAQFALLRRYRLTQSVIDSDYAALLGAFGRKLSVQVALDTGMHRLGERCDQIDGILRIFSHRNLVVRGIYSHLCADDIDSPEAHAFTRLQAESLDSTITLLRKAGYACKNVHLQASYGLVNYPALGGSAVRAGIALYGLLSTRQDTEKCTLALQPVLSLKARVVLVKDLFAGETAGYGFSFTAARNSKIAVLSIGYADGLSRALSCGAGSVLINGCAAPIIGRICMDQTIVDVTDVPNVSPGDVGVLIGTSGEMEISACDLAGQTGTISNEVLSRLGKRLERIVVP